ncbi:MAG: DUF305 domain-containing protein [Cyanobium sp. M30B3]|nr:MAG: DUF305 domain-containing protein [Cyanobium sp. M30B3]
MGGIHGERLCWAALISAGLGIAAPLAVAEGQAAPQPQPQPASCPLGLQSVDQRFIVMMIPHHDGAIAMAELARTRSQRPQIRALAKQIKASQTAENDQMRRWYRQWYGADVPAWPAGGRGPGRGYGMGPRWGRAGRMGPGGGMPGMGTSLEALRTAPDFDRAFIEQMVPHHRMGVMMASHAQWHTQRRELRELQAEMVKVQSQEIAQMEQWYRQWYGASGG